jgi:hypothetical protein
MQESGGFHKTKSPIAKLLFAIDHRRYSRLLTLRVIQFTVWSRTCPMATAVFGRWPRAASAGSLGQANPQALIGQSPLPLLTPVSLLRFPFAPSGFRLHSCCYAPSDKIRSGSLRDQTAGETGLDLYVRVVSQPTVL